MIDDKKSKYLDYDNVSGNWSKRHILRVFWNKNIVSELCEMWIFCYGNYAYIRFEELCTCSGEVLFTREHKATLSKEKSLTYIDMILLILRYLVICILKMSSYLKLRKNIKVL